MTWPPSLQDVDAAQNHLVLLKSRIRQHKTQRTPPGSSGGEDYSTSSSSKRGAEPNLRNGRFEYVAADHTALGDGSYTASAQPLGRQRSAASRARDSTSGKMTWDAPTVPNEELLVPAVASRAAAPRRIANDGGAPAFGGGGGASPAYDGLNASLDSGYGRGRQHLSSPMAGAYGQDQLLASSAGGRGSHGLAQRLGSSMDGDYGLEQPLRGGTDELEQPLGGGSGSHGLGPPPFNTMNGADAYPEAASGELIPCPDCGRKFGAESIDRHIKICKKVFVNKRKQFSSVAVRLGEFENAQSLIANAERIQRNKDAPAKKEKDSRKSVPAWKKKSLELRAAILSAKVDSGDAEAQLKAEEIQQQLGPAGGDLDPDSLKCPHCGRVFNKEAGERHIAICVKTFGTKPGGGRLIKGGGRRMFEDTPDRPGSTKNSATPASASTRGLQPSYPTTPSGGNRAGGNAQVLSTSSSTPQAAQVSRMGSLGQGLEAGGSTGVTRSGSYGSGSVVRTSSGAGGLSTGGYSAAGYSTGGYPDGYAGATAQNRRPSSSRTRSSTSFTR